MRSFDIRKAVFSASMALAVLGGLILLGHPGDAPASGPAAVTPAKKGFSFERGARRARPGQFSLAGRKRLYLRFRVPADWSKDAARLAITPGRSSARGLLVRSARARWKRGAPHRTSLPPGGATKRTGAVRKGVTKTVDVSSMVSPGRAATIRIEAAPGTRALLRRIPYLFAVSPSPDPPPEPEPEPGDAVQLSAVGDIACSPDSSQWNGGAGTASECRQADVADLVSDQDEAVLLLGDVQYPDGTLAQFQAGFDPSWGHLADRLKPTPGNHEYYTSGASGYFDYFDDLGVETGGSGMGYYEFDLGEWTILSLNSNCSSVACGAGSQQETWFRERLSRARTAERCTLAFWHHPAASSGVHGNQARVADLWSAFVELGGDVLLTGHDHHYERFAMLDSGLSETDDGPLSWVVGTGGKSLRSVSSPSPGTERLIDDAYGLVRFELAAESFSWQWSGVGGARTDSGSSSCRA